MKKKILCTLILALIIISITNVIFGFQDVLDNPDLYKPGNTDSTKAENAISKVLSVVSLVGTVISVVALGTLGLKYMLGSVEEKAEYKQSLGPYVIGAVMLFAITTITQIIINIGNEISNL